MAMPDPRRWRSTWTRGGASRGEPGSLPLVANSIALVAGKLATLGAGFLAWLVAARLFAQDDVGLASGAVSAMMLCVQIALFGAGAAVIVLLPRHRSDPAALLDTAITLVAATSLACAAGFLLVARGLAGDLGAIAGSAAYVAAFLAMTVSGTLGVLLDLLSTSLGRGDQALVRGLISGGVTFLLMGLLPLATGQRGTLLILLAWAIGNLAPVLFGVLQLRGSLPHYRFRPRLELPLAARMTRIGLPNWVLTLAERAPGSILPLVVTELLSPSANAAWYAAWMMAWVVYVVPIQVGLSLFAEAASTADPARQRRAVRSGLLTSLGIGALAALGAAIVGPRLLEILGQGYADGGTRPLRILVLAVVPFTFIQGHFSICRARGLLGEAIATGAVAAAAGIGGAALVARAHGLDGMALVWLGVQSAVGIWSVLRLRRHVWRAAAAPAPELAAPELGPRPSRTVA